VTVCTAFGNGCIHSIFGTSDASKLIFIVTYLNKQYIKLLCNPDHFDSSHLLPVYLSMWLKHPGVTGLVVEYWTPVFLQSECHCGHLQATLSKLLTYMLRPTQPPNLSGTVVAYRLWGELKA